MKKNNILEFKKKKFDLSLAELNVKIAKHNFEIKHYDWAVFIAYTAVLQAGRAFMFHQGPLPLEKNQEKALLEFLDVYKIAPSSILYFSNLRKTRHLSPLNISNTVSESMSRTVIQEAENLVKQIKNFVYENEQPRSKGQGIVE